MVREEGVPAIVDGAHALGATPVDLKALGSPAFWFGNGHKYVRSSHPPAPLPSLPV